jgi:hypothetical protein
MMKKGKALDIKALQAPQDRSKEQFILGLQPFAQAKDIVLVGGKMAHELLTNIVNAPGYDQIPDMIKKNIFARVLTASHKIAALQALPMDKRMSYLQSVTEKMQQALEPGATQ